MNWIVALMHWVNGFVGNMGWTIVLFVCFSQILLIPLKIFSHKNNKAKAACEPEIRAIRKKYNANQLGVSMEDSSELPANIRNMNHNQRSEAMAKEIDDTYKKYGYNVWLSWLPMVMNLVIVICLWKAINNAANTDFYMITFKDINSVAGVDYTNNILLLATVPVLSFLSSIIGGISQIIAKRKNKKELVGTIIGVFVSCVLTVGLALWITTSVSTAIAIAIATIYACTIIGSIVKKLFYKKPTDNEQMS